CQVKLKGRFKIRRLSVRIADAHGRFVRTIRLHYHTKPVANLNDLKLPENVAKWRLAGTVEVPRDKTSVQLDLAIPLSCANIMIEFADFHPDPARADDAAGGGSGGRRGHGSGGALHCPRCGRPVTDMHGVCRQCGEVAFQCCQCRHINYESLEAFLCVECGYCAYAHFGFRITAAMETDIAPVRTEVRR
ncbi:unnamed protein product, partial [Sphacelaria rigidula]